MNAYSAQNTYEFVKRYWPDRSDLPKHERLSKAFTSSIMDGFWTSGARLPTEAELVTATPCSLGTVQRALRNLVSEGIIERRRGSGTVVANLNRPIEEPWHMRFLDDTIDSTVALPIFTTVLKRKLLTVSGPWSKSIGQKGKSVVKIDRIFDINDTVKIYSSFYAAAHQFPELAREPISTLNGKNIKMMIARRYRVPVHKVRQSIRIEVPCDEIISASDCLANTPTSVLNVIAYALDGEAMYYQDFYLPPFDYRLDLGTSVQK